MSNKKLYKDTFDKITMSEEAFGKVREMRINEQKTKRKMSFRFATVLAALAVVFALSNGIAYAASGSTLVEKVVIYIDGQMHDASEMTKMMDEDGNECYEYEFKEGESEVAVSYSMDENAQGKNNMSVEEEYNTNSSTEETTIFYGVLEEEDGKVFLIIGNNLKKIDITDDFQDGNASGEFELEGESYQYTIEGSVKDSSITFQNK